MNCNEECTLVFGEASDEEAVKTLKSFLARMRSGLARLEDRYFRVAVVHYKFISRSGTVVVDQVREVDVSCLFDLDSRESSWSALYTHHGLVASDLLILLKEEHKWDGYHLEVTLQGFTMEEESVGFLEVS